MRKPRSDKGKTRKPYRLNTRLARKEAKDLKRTLADIQKFDQKAIEGPKKKQRDLFNKTKYAHKTTRAERKRARVLRDLPEDRRCPRCNNMKLETKKWVIMRDKESNRVITICKSCYTKTRKLYDSLVEIMLNSNNIARPVVYQEGNDYMIVSHRSTWKDFVRWANAIQNTTWSFDCEGKSVSLCNCIRCKMTEFLQLGITRERGNDGTDNAGSVGICQTELGPT
jgi:transcription elongation factor Elf1